MTLRHNRQRLIPGFNQKAIGGATIAILGRNDCGLLTARGLGGLGAGRIVIFGAPREKLFSRLTPALAERGVILRPNVEYPTDLSPFEPIAAGIDCGDDPAASALLERALTGGTTFRTDPTMADHPVLAMVGAGAAVDAVRQKLSPLPNDLGAARETLEWKLPMTPALGDAMAIVVGTGAIGGDVLLLAGSLGWRVVAVDDDVVDETNLGRQLLFEDADAHAGRHKAVAARDGVLRLFPKASIAAHVGRATAEFHKPLAKLGRPVLLSCVDNAASRLVLQDLARELSLRLVQGGTDTHAADVYVQEPGGPTIDEQMSGALSAAAGAEAQGIRRAPCGITVVPGMMAAAMMVRRRLDTSDADRPAFSSHWRSGQYPLDKLCTQGAVDEPDIDHNPRWPGW